ncbi:agmatinase [Mycobacterium frederiksbergense]|uniref:Agmatinase n=1 Tax=Mycolicibacterium frederiksbergense TaxID=117567 RepID=A0ABT6KY07_9MYCO|nr:arginase family protein [Mycolicibacterium frederiksbergense]MDH6195585.1 agmatinase [Mycolicibacterium frederiksbergense]
MSDPSDRLNLPFVGIPSYMRSPIVQDLSTLDADLAVLGVPSDEGSPWYPGARMAPRRMREMSVRYAGYGKMQRRPGYFDIETGQRFLGYEMANQRIADCGDVDIIYTNPEATYRNITRSTSQILEAGAIPLVMGGDHAVTWGVVRAYEEPITVVHFDAHLDYRPFVHGAEYGNGSPMLKIGNLPNVGTMIQVGARGLRASIDDLERTRERGNHVITMANYREHGIKAVTDALPENGKVYVSVDIDILDLPLVPGCASAEADGLTYNELRQTIFAIVAKNELVGFDVVEINPMLDVASNNTSLLGTQLMIETAGRAVLNPAYLARKGRAAEEAVTDAVLS